MTTRTQTTGTQAQRGIVPQLQNEIQSLQAQFSELERRVFGTGGGGGNSRQGTAGGVRARRATTGAVARSPAGNAGGGDNTEWVAEYLKTHAEGLTRPQIKQAAIAAGLTIGKDFPYGCIGTLGRNGRIKQKGELYFLKTTGGTGPVARSGTSRTRTKKPIARTMHTMTAAG